MATITIVPYEAAYDPMVIAEFEEVLHHSQLRYSMRHLIMAGVTSEDVFYDILDRSMHVCRISGINAAHHFKQIYVFDPETGEMYIDWLMSKKGFKLIIMQYPHLNEQLAHWLWELADV